VILYSIRGFTTAPMFRGDRHQSLTAGSHVIKVGVIRRCNGSPEEVISFGRICRAEYGDSRGTLTFWFGAYPSLDSGRLMN